MASWTKYRWDEKQQKYVAVSGPDQSSPYAPSSTASGKTSTSSSVSRGETNRNGRGIPAGKTSQPTYGSLSSYSSYASEKPKNFFEALEKSWGDWLEFTRKQRGEVDETPEQREARSSLAQAAVNDLGKMTETESSRQAVMDGVNSGNADFAKFQAGKNAYNADLYYNNLIRHIDALDIPEEQKQRILGVAQQNRSSANEIYALARVGAGDMSAFNNLYGDTRKEAERVGRLYAYDTAGEMMQRQLPKDQRIAATIPVDIPANYDLDAFREDRFKYLYGESISGEKITEQERQAAKQRLEMATGIEDVSKVTDWSKVDYDPDYMADMQRLNRGAETYSDLWNMTGNYSNEDVQNDLMTIQDYQNGQRAGTSPFYLAPQVSEDAYQRALDRVYALTGIDMSDAGNYEKNSAAVRDIDAVMRQTAAEPIMQAAGDMPGGTAPSVEDYQTYLSAYAKQQSDIEREQREAAELDRLMQDKWGGYSGGTYEPRDEVWSGGYDDADLVYELVAAGDDEKKRAEVIQNGTGAIGNDFALNRRFNAGYQFMTDDERARFFAVWDQEGPERALEYLDDLSPKLLKAENKRKEESYAAFANENPLAANLAARLGTMVSAAEYIPNVISNALTGKQFSDAGARFTQAVTSRTAQNIADATPNAELFGRNIPALLYQAGTAAADSGLLALSGNPTLATAVLSSSAANATLTSRLDEGADFTDAIRDSAAVGVIEMLTEKYSVEALMSDPASLLGYIGKNMATEAAEEMTSSVLNIAYDMVAYGDDSEVAQRFRQLVIEGYSPEEAFGQVAKEKAGETIESGVVGALSGGMGATPSGTATAISDRSSGKNLQKNDAARSVLDLAGKMLPDGDIKALATEQLKALDGEGKTSNSAIGRVFRELLANVDEHTREILDGTMQRSVRDQLREMGVDDPRLAAAVTRVAAGDGSASAEDYVAVASNDAARSVANSLTAKVEYVSGLNDQVGGLTEKAKKPPKTKNTEHTTANATEKAPATEAADEEIVDDEFAEDEFSDEEIADEEFADEPMSDSSVTSDGEEVSVVGVESVDKSGELTFKVQTADGTQKGVKASDVTLGLNDSDAVVLARAAQEYGANADTMFNAHVPGQDAAEYAAAFKKAAQYGRDGMNMETISGYDSVKALNPNQLGIAYELGRSERTSRSKSARNIMAERMIANGKVKTGNVDISGINVSGLNQHQKRSIVAMRNMAELLGINVKFTESVADEQGRYTTANGSWNSKTLTLTLDVHAGTNIATDINYAMMHTASHELTHAIFQFAYTDVRDDYIDFVLGSLGRKMGDAAVEAEIAKWLERPGINSRDAAIEEIVAEASVEALSKMTEQDIRNLAMEKPSLARRIATSIYDWVARMKAKIAKAFGGTEAKNEYAKMLNDQLDELAEKWNSALLNAVQNKNKIQRAAFEKQMEQGVEIKSGRRSRTADRYAASETDQSSEDDDYIPLDDDDGSGMRIRPERRSERRAERRAERGGRERVDREGNKTRSGRLTAIRAKLDSAIAKFAADDATKKQSDQDGLPLANNHIDQRTPESVRDSDTTLFCSEVEEAQVGFAAAANMLLYDAENSVRGQKFFTGDGEVTGQTRMTSPMLGKIKDSTGWTWGKIINSLRQFAAMETGDTMPKNTVTNREMELYLDEVLSKGYTTLDGQKVSPWGEYIEAKNGYQGSDGTTAPQSAYDGAIDFAEYAFAGDFEDGSGVKFSARDDSDEANTMRDQIKNRQFDLNKMHPVANKEVELPQKRDKSSKIEWAMQQLEDSGYEVERTGFGRVVFDRKRIKTGLGYIHANDDGRLAAIAAIPEVLRDGIEVGVHYDHKDRRYPSVTFAAPVVINGVRGNMAVAVIQTNANNYRAHRILMPDGSGFEFVQKNNAVTGTSGRAGESPRLSQSTGSASANSIADDGDGVKFSARENQTTTPEFRRWFKDSKIVNPDGSPKVMYHGNPNSFTVFDIKKAKSSGLYGKGFYFTDSESHGGTYGKLYSVYLSIQNPLTPGGANVSRTQVRKFLEAVAENEDDYSIENYGTYDVNEILRNVYCKDAFAVIQDVNATAIGDLVEAVKLFNEVNGTTFDGIVVNTETVAFEPAQIKSATDNVGTFDPKNPDIRHQLRDPDQISDRELLSNVMESAATNEAELDFVRRYRSQIDRLNEKQAELEQVSREITEARKNGARKSDIAVMQEKAKILRKQLDRMDGQLLKFEAGKPLQDVVKRQRAELQEKARERANKRVAEVRRKEAEYRDELRERVTKLRNEKNARIEQLKREKTAAVKKVRDEKNESFARQKYRKRLEEDMNTLRTWVTSPTNKEHVPQFMRKPLGDMIASLDFSSVRSLDGGDPTQKDAKLKDALDAMNLALTQLRNQQDGLDQGAAQFATIIDLPFGYNEEFTELVQKIKTTLSATQNSNDIAINRMTGAQLKDLSRAIRTLTTSIRQMNRLLANAKYESAITAANDSMNELDKMTAKKDSLKVTAGLGRFIDWANTVPYYAFKRFGNGGKAIFSGLMDGWDKLAFNSDKLVKFADETYTVKEVRAWSKEVHSVQLDNGETVRMTTAQMMSLYCLGKRAQAVGHLLGGGIRIADIETRGKRVSQSDNHTITQRDIDSIGNSLTARQREVADKLQEFMSTQGAEWGNEISMKRFGYEMFTEKHYFPIETDSNNRATIDEQAQENSLFRLLNMSATKALVKGANNAIVVRDIFDVFTAHSSDMAKYNALGLQILDAMKWLNYVERTQNEDGSITTRSMQKSLERAYGTDARSYIIQLLRDLNGVKEGGKEGDFYSKFVSNAKVASVAGNIRVYLLQATSMPRAAYAINPAYLSVGLAKTAANPVKAVKTAISKVGIAKWKSMGFYDTNISGNIREMVKHDQSVADKFREASMAPAGWLDNMTMATIYYAAEAECAKKYPNTKKGSATWDKLVNDRVRDIVYQTQVVDSTMTRSSAMRSQNALLKLSTSFMSEPTLTLNMLMDGVYEARMKRRGADIKAPTAKIVKGAGVFVLAAVLTAAMEALFDAERDDDEFETFAEKYMDAFIGDITEDDTAWKKFTKVLFSNLGSNLNILNNVPVVSELMSTLEGYESSNLYSAFLGSFQSAFNAYNRYLEGKGTMYSWIYSGLKGVSQLTGLPVSNLAREGVSAWNTFFAERYDKIRVQTYANTETEAANAIMDAEIRGDEVRATEIRERAALYGMDEAKIATKLTNLAKDAYMKGDISRNAAAKFMTEEGGKRSREADEALTEADYQIETGRKHNDMKDDFVSGLITEQQALEYLKKYDGLRDDEIDTKISQWKYDKETGLKYSEMKLDYIDGVLTDSQVVNYRTKYGGADQDSAEETLGHWKYEKDTGLAWSDMEDDYADGVINEYEVRDALARYGGKNEEEVEDKISNFDYHIATGRSTTAPKYWRIAYAFDTGGDYVSYIDQYFQKIMYGGETTRTWKQARSSIASSLASYYKNQYLAAKGTPAGAAMLERILDLYEAIGYDREYERKYIAENW